MKKNKLIGNKRTREIEFKDIEDLDSLPFKKKGKTYELTENKFSITPDPNKPSHEMIMLFNEQYNTAKSQLKSLCRRRVNLTKEEWEALSNRNSEILNSLYQEIGFLNDLITSLKGMLMYTYPEFDKGFKREKGSDIKKEPSKEQKELIRFFEKFPDQKTKSAQQVVDAIESANKDIQSQNKSRIQNDLPLLQSYKVVSERTIERARKNKIDGIS